MVKFHAVCLLLGMATGVVHAQTCPVFVPKGASFVSADKTPTEGSMSYVLDGEGDTGLPSSGYGNYGVYWLQSVNPVTFTFNMDAVSTISRVKFYQPWGFDEGPKNITVRLYNGATLLGTEAILLPSMYSAGYVVILSKTYTNVTKIQMVIVDDYNISSATPKRTSLTEVVFGDTACDDVDGDGVPDYLDLDNDNDGIKDIDENCSGFLAQNTTGPWKGKTSSTLTATLTGATAQTYSNTLFDTQTHYYVNQNGGEGRVTKFGNISFTYSFSTPVPAKEIAFFINDLDPSLGSGSAVITFKVNGGHPNGNFASINYNSILNPPVNFLTFDNISGRITVTGTNDDQVLLIKGIGDLLVSTITITSTGINTANDQLQYSLFANHPCDTDGDGIPDILDLDSDGDGCPDAIEGAGNFNPTTTASGTLSTQNPNINFGTMVDVNGVPTAVGASGQGVGTSQNNAISECVGVATDDINQTPQGKPVSGNLLTNDTNLTTVTGATFNGTNITIGTLTTLTVGTTTYGTITVNANGTYTFTPATGYTGSVPPITYTATNVNGGTDNANLYINVIKDVVTGVNNPPVANPDVATVQQGTAVTVHPLANDSDPDKDALTVTSISYNGTTISTSSTSPTTITVGGVTAGTAYQDASGNLIFTANPSYTGDVPFTYVISDGKGGTATSSINVTVTSTPTPSIVANDDAKSAPQGTTITGTVKDNDIWGGQIRLLQQRQ